MPLNQNSHLYSLMKSFPRQGIVSWIGIRPEKRGEVISVQKVQAVAGKGLTGDHYTGNNGSRQVTLIQFEHLEVISSLMGIKEVDPRLLRRNIAVRGLNLLSLKEVRFAIGTAILEMTGLCQPCSRMEENLGEGGYNSVRGHGGITARIIKDGVIQIGDEVAILKEV
jgi:MOSC domain-containing protein YiiM